MRIKVWLSILLCLGMLAGCLYFANTSLDLRGLAANEDNPELTPDFFDETKTQTPDILVNQLGYRPQDKKIAILQGSGLQSAFSVHDAATDKAVMTGTLKEAGAAVYQDAPKEKEEGSVLYLADFSGLEKEGDYYLFHEELGSSDVFGVKKDIYASLEAYILEELAVENRDISSLCYQLAGMLFALELYPSQIEEPQKLQRILAEKTELLSRAWNQENGSLDETEEGEAAAESAGVMAMYAEYLQSIDQALAKEYQTMAERAYAVSLNSQDEISDDAGYFAAAQLFRRTGKTEYAQAIDQYLLKPQEERSSTRYDFTLFGDYGYLSCRYKTNLEWSRQLMNKVMKQAEKISLSSSRERYYLSQNREQYEVDGILQDMAVMALVNYIITNHEYSTLQKNYLDYLLGRNPEGYCLVEGFGTRNMPQGQMVDKENAALFYLLLQSAK